MDFINVILKLLVLLILETFLVVIFTLLSNRIKNPILRIIDDKEVPTCIKAFLEDSCNRLVKLGFSLSCYFYKEGLYADANSDNWGVILLNYKRTTFALIRIADHPNKLNPCSTEFITYFKDNSSLLTINDYKHFVIGKIPNVVLNDPYAVTTEQQWYSHLNILNKLKNNSEAIIPNNEAVVCYENITNRNYIDRLFSENKIVECDKDCYRLTFLTAFAQVFKILLGLKSHFVLRKSKMKLFADLPEISYSIILEKYRYASLESSSKNKSFYKDTILNFVYISLLIISSLLFPIDYIIAGLIMIIFLKSGRSIERMLFCNQNTKTQL